MLAKSTIISKDPSYRKQCFENAQYSRRECLEISDISSSVGDNDHENFFCKGITQAGVEMSDKDIGGCHRVGKWG